jgi:8-oxo-dGTP pyrophosphatase MutT (NUDIX family)
MSDLQLDRTQIAQLKAAFTRPLPGIEAQLQLAHKLRIQELERSKPDNDHKKAGVVVLIFAEGETLKTTLIARTTNPRDVHSGQISFPGGRIDSTDLSIEAGALRELHEEVGVAHDQIEMLGPLSEIYIPVSNFLVYPFVVYAQTPPQFTKQEGEVIDVLTPELNFFLDKRNIQYKQITVGQGFILEDVPCFDIDGHTLWGATAMIIGELIEVIRQLK